IAALGSVCAAMLGIAGLVAPGSAVRNAATYSLAYLDLSNTDDWRRAAVAGARASPLVGYAVVHAIFCWRPRSRWPILARATFTVAGCVVAVRLMHFVITAPPERGCGMKWLADLAPFLLAAAFAAVEFAAWRSWGAQHKG